MHVGGVDHMAFYRALLIAICVRTACVAQALLEASFSMRSNGGDGRVQQGSLLCSLGAQEVQVVPEEGKGGYAVRLPGAARGVVDCWLGWSLWYGRCADGSPYIAVLGPRNGRIRVVTSTLALDEWVSAAVDQRAGGIFVLTSTDRLMFLPLHADEHVGVGLDWGNATVTSVAASLQALTSPVLRSRVGASVMLVGWESGVPSGRCYECAVDGSRIVLRALSQEESIADASEGWVVTDTNIERVSIVGGDSGIIVDREANRRIRFSSNGGHVNGLGIGLVPGREYFLEGSSGRSPSIPFVPMLVREESGYGIRGWHVRSMTIIGNGICPGAYVVARADINDAREFGSVMWVFSASDGLAPPMEGGIIKSGQLCSGVRDAQGGAVCRVRISEEHDWVGKTLWVQCFLHEQEEIVAVSRVYGLSIQGQVVGADKADPAGNLLDCQTLSFAPPRDGLHDRYLSSVRAVLESRR